MDAIIEITRPNTVYISRFEFTNESKELADEDKCKRRFSTGLNDTKTKSISCVQTVVNVEEFVNNDNRNPADEVEEPAENEQDVFDFHLRETVVHCPMKPMVIVHRVFRYSFVELLLNFDQENNNVDSNIVVEIQLEIVDEVCVDISPN